MNQISIKQIPGIKIGSAEDRQAATGCTVFVCEEGMSAGISVMGGGPASRESELLHPVTAAHGIHAIVLAGGSAYGLDAAGGVMQYLEERGIGFDTGVAKVPLVCQSGIFDLAIGSADVRPDKAMGYEACANAFAGNFQDGCFGAGTGATVGKITGMEHCVKTGVGSYAVRIGDFLLGAVAVANAFGDVYDFHTGEILAGARAEDGRSFIGTEKRLLADYEKKENRFTDNTTLGVIITNAAFNKTQLCKIAGMAQDGYARSIRPVHTSADGDTIYAVSIGNVQADQDLVGELAADILAEAVLAAVRNAEDLCGIPSYRSLNM